MKTTIFENLMYPVLVLLILGQCLVGSYFLLGQCIYLVANCSMLARDFALDRPRADKIKNICFVGITLALILLRIL